MLWLHVNPHHHALVVVAFDVACQLHELRVTKLPYDRADSTRLYDQNVVVLMAGSRHRLDAPSVLTLLRPVANDELMANGTPVVKNDLNGLPGSDDPMAGDEAVRIGRLQRSVH